MILENKELDRASTSPETGLTFEIDSPNEVAFSFEAELDPAPQSENREVDLSITSLEIEIEETPKSNIEFTTDTTERTGYVPRFTEVSDNFRMRDDIRYRERRTTPTVTTVGAMPDTTPDIDPTSEALEEKPFA